MKKDKIGGNMDKRVVIAGSRYFNDYHLFTDIVDEYLSEIKLKYRIIILSGHCSGTDIMAERYAYEHSYQLEVFSANWSLGKKAGPLRNKEMIDKADMAIAFFSGGRGTKSLIDFAKKKGIPLKVYSVNK